LKCTADILTLIHFYCTVSFIHLFSVDLLQDMEIVIYNNIVQEKRQNKTKEQHTVYTIVLILIHFYYIILFISVCINAYIINFNLYVIIVKLGCIFYIQ
jgi:hypothetical protein